jgi:hypothetical protein
MTPYTGGSFAESAAFVVQRLTRILSNSGAPWSPLSVSVIALLLPAGGAILTIRNLQRLHSIDAEKARELIIASVGVFAVGIVILLLLAPLGTSGPSTSGDTTAVLGGGMAVVSYLVQRPAFRAWRLEHRTTRTGSWMAAVGTATLFTVVTLVAAVPVMLVAMLTAGIGG